MNKSMQRVLSATFVPAEPLGAIRIWRAGDNATDYGVHRWTERSARDVAAEYARRGNSIQLDIEHNAAEAPDPANPAIGGGYGRLEFRPDGLYLIPEWSEPALEMIRTRQRLHVSPEYDVDKSTGEILRLYRVSLVADPATHNAQRVAASVEPPKPRPTAFQIECIRGAIDLLAKTKREVAWLAAGGFHALARQKRERDMATASVMIRAAAGEFSKKEESAMPDDPKNASLPPTTKWSAIPEACGLDADATVADVLKSCGLDASAAVSNLLAACGGMAPASAAPGDASSDAPADKMTAARRELAERMGIRLPSHGVYHERTSVVFPTMTPEQARAFRASRGLR